MTRAKAHLLVPKDILLALTEANASRVVKANVEACVTTLVRHKICPVQKNGRVMKHALEVHERCPAVGLPTNGQREVLSVPGRIARQVAVVQVRRVLCEVAVFRNKIVRGVDYVPIVIDVRCSVSRCEEIVLRRET